MCGRYALGVNPDVAQQVRNDYPAVAPRRWQGQQNHRPRYNVAPRSFAPVLRQDPQNPHQYMLHQMRWGVIPHWTKHEPEKTAPLNTINARAEALLEGGGMWGSLKGRKRCLVPCDGYYEWHKKGTTRTPHFTRHPSGKLLLLAGLWDSVTFENSSEALYTYTIITTESSKELGWLHDRMPVVLDREEELRLWLDTSTEGWSEELGRLLRPYEGHLECYPVAAEVGNVKNDSPTFIQPVSKRADGIEAMFQKQQKKQDPKQDTQSGQPTHPKSSPNSAKTEKGGVKREREEVEENKQFDKSEEASLKLEEDEKGEGGAIVTEDNQPSQSQPSTTPATKPHKRKVIPKSEASSQEIVELSPPPKKMKQEPKSTPARPGKGTPGKRKPTPGKGKGEEEEGTMKITSFFGGTPEKAKGEKKITSFFKQKD